MIWQLLLRAALGALATLVLSFVKNLQAARLDDLMLTEEVARIIHRTASQTGLSNEGKREQAVNSLRAWAKALGRDMSESLARTSVELGVQRMKDAEAPKA